MANLEKFYIPQYDKAGIYAVINRTKMIAYVGQKYGNGLTTVWVKPDATLGKDFFEHIEEIGQAQQVVNKYHRVLKNW